MKAFFKEAARRFEAVVEVIVFGTTPLESELKLKNQFLEGERQRMLRAPDVYNPRPYPPPMIPAKLGGSNWIR